MNLSEELKNILFGDKIKSDKAVDFNITKNYFYLLKSIGVEYMDKNSLLIGLGGVGGSSFSRILSNSTDEQDEPRFLVIECSELNENEKNK